MLKMSNSFALWIVLVSNLGFLGVLFPNSRQLRLERRKVANRISPDAGFVTVAEIDNQTAVVERPADEALTPSDRRR